MSEVLSAVRCHLRKTAWGATRAWTKACGRSSTPWTGWGELRSGASQNLDVVGTYLAGCRALAHDPLAERLVTAIDREPREVAWYRSKSYDGESSMVDFLPQYGVALIFGPDRFGRRCPYLSDRASLGVTLQAPNMDYPAHAHEAVEIYFILAGSVEWQQGDGVWRRLTSGDFVLHKAHEPHAMRTGEEPLLAMFAWVSDLMSEVYLVESA